LSALKVEEKATIKEKTRTQVGSMKKTSRRSEGVDVKRGNTGIYFFGIYWDLL
jgi:hypothetical protein